MPGVLLEESLGDPVKELVNRFFGPQEAANRQVIKASIKLFLLFLGRDYTDDHR